MTEQGMTELPADPGDRAPEPNRATVIERILAWLQLCRTANVFTALADIFSGYLLTHPHLGEVFDEGIRVDSPRLAFDAPFRWLLGASACLYLAGMVFNDVFDRRVDAVERPGRPIPSGRVPLAGAIGLGAVFVAVGLTCAALAGWTSLLVALLLLSAIFAYDGLLKSTPVGPIVMGACRFFNILLGASAVGGEGNPFLNVFALPQLHVALAMTVYIAGVTWFARRETGGGSRRSLIGAAVVLNLGLALLMAFVLHAPDGHGRSMTCLLLIGAVMVIVNRRMLPALLEPSPGLMQEAIRMMLMSLLTLNASLCLFAHQEPLYAVIVIGFWIPSFALSWFLAVT